MDDNHAEMVAAFFREVWDEHATAASVAASRAAGAARNTAEPGLAPPTWIAIRDGRVLGYVTTLPVRLWDGAREWPAYWIKGLMVLRGVPRRTDRVPGPEGRGRRPAAERGAGGRASRRAGCSRRLGSRIFGAVPNWVWLLSPAHLPSLGSCRPRYFPPVQRGHDCLASRAELRMVRGWSAGGVALRATAAVRRLSATGLDAGDFDPKRAAAELDELWKTARAGLPSAVVRDAQYLIDRYPIGAGDNYLWLSARRRGVLAGVAILRRPRADGDERLRGIRVATLADILYRPDQPGRRPGTAWGAWSARPGISVPTPFFADCLRTILRSRSEEAVVPAVVGQRPLSLSRCGGSGARPSGRRSPSGGFPEAMDRPTRRSRKCRTHSLCPTGGGCRLRTSGCNADRRCRDDDSCPPRQSDTLTQPEAGSLDEPPQHGGESDAEDDPAEEYGNRGRRAPGPGSSAAPGSRSATPPTSGRGIGCS